VYGTSQIPITQLAISGNEVYQLKTGQSESVNVDGNVTHFNITNNLVHDNDNIGIDAIGYEGVGPVVRTVQAQLMQLAHRPHQALLRPNPVLERTGELDHFR
jgi:hypothetical protein